MPMPNEPDVTGEAKVTMPKRYAKECEHSGYVFMCATCIESMVDSELTRLQAENKRIREALDRIASWKEGPEVKWSFDEPESARIAREALSLPSGDGNP